MLYYLSVLTQALLIHLLSKVRYRDWRFHVKPFGVGFLLQCRWAEGDDVQHGRKWYVSPHAGEGEVVQTALLAVLTALEHEAREQFTYDGATIFGPHFAPTALVQMARDKASQASRPPLPVSPSPQPSH